MLPISENLAATTLDNCGSNGVCKNGGMPEGNLEVDK
jgi:hypothetical protein